MAGCAIAGSGTDKLIETFGVEVASYSAMAQELSGAPVDVGGATIAKGIAVREVGRTPLEILRRHGMSVLTVPERAIEDAIALLAEKAEIVAE